MAIRISGASLFLGSVVLALWPDVVVRTYARQPPATATNARPASAAPHAADWPWKLSDGQPDVQGYWGAVGTEGGMGLVLEAPVTPTGGRGMRGVVVDPADGQIPYLPWARVRRDEVREHYLSPNPGQLDTSTRAWPDSVPRLNYYGIHPFQILQPRGAVVVLYEKQHEFRFIPLDARPQPDNGVKLWIGSSRGRWEGTTLVVDVTNITDRVRFSVVGDFASDEVKLTERWHFVDADTITLSATFEDPKVFSRPWTVAKTIKRVKEPGTEIMEYAGVEGDKDSQLMVDIPAGLKK